MKRRRGGSIRMHRSDLRFQRGRGRPRGAGALSILSKLVRPVISLFKKAAPKAIATARKISKTPAAKKMMKEAKKALVQSGTEVTGHLIKGDKAAAKASVKKAREKVGNMVLHTSANLNSKPSTIPKQGNKRKVGSKKNKRGHKFRINTNRLV